jgi:hypothetical protein
VGVLAASAHPDVLEKLIERLGWAARGGSK